MRLRGRSLARKHRCRGDGELLIRHLAAGSALVHVPDLVRDAHRSVRLLYSASSAFQSVYFGPTQRAVPIAKYKFAQGGRVLPAYHTRKLPSGMRISDWLVV